MRQSVTRRAFLAGTASAVGAGSAHAHSGDGSGGGIDTDHDTTNDELDVTEPEEESEHEEQEEEQGHPPGLRTINLSPDTPAYDLYVDGELVFEGVGHLDPHVDAFPLPDDSAEATIAAVPQGGDPSQPLGETQLDVSGDERAEYGWTAWGVGEQCSASDTPFQVVIVEDDHSPTPPGKARIIGTHFAPDTGPVDARLEDGTSLFKDKAFGESETIEIPAMDPQEFEAAGGRDEVDPVPVAIHPAGEDEVINTYPTWPLEGRVYSASLVGYQDLDNAPAAVEGDWSLGLAISEDSIPGVEGDGGEQGDDHNANARMRLH